MNPEPIGADAVPGTDLAVHAAPDLSVVALVPEADPVVKAVMVLLVLASVACWAIILDKAVRLRRLRRETAELERRLETGAPIPAAGDLSGIASEIVRAGLEEWRDRTAADETRAERRERIERAMRDVVARSLRQAEPGLPFLATVGSSAPFVGLFGTVRRPLWHRLGHHEQLHGDRRHERHQPRRGGSRHRGGPVRHGRRARRRDPCRDRL
jgi:biopolymer transport protein TolQ